VKTGLQIKSSPEAGNPWVHRLHVVFFSIFCLYFILLVTGWKFDIRNVLAVATLVLTVVLVAINPGWHRISRQEQLFAGLLIAFIGANILAVILAPDIPDRGKFQSRNLHLTGIFIALSAGLGLRNQQKLKNLLWVLLSLAGLWFLGEALSLPWRNDAWMDNRFSGFRGHHALLGMELAIWACLFFGLVVMLRKWSGLILALAGIVLMTTLLLLNNTRGALLTTACVSIPVLLLLQKRWGSWSRRLWAAGIWLFLIVPVCVILWGNLTTPKRKSSRTLASRWSAYKTTAKICRQEPWSRVLIGNGRSSKIFEAAATHYGAPRDWRERAYFAHAHNVLLQTFIETGLLGVLLLFSIWFMALRSVFSVWPGSRGETATMAAVFIAVLFTIAAIAQADYLLWQVPGELSWLMVGMAFACGRKTVDTKKTGGPPESSPPININS
jgi:O-antigen ligase